MKEIVKTAKTEGQRQVTRDTTGKQHQCGASGPFHTFYYTRGGSNWSATTCSKWVQHNTSIIMLVVLNIGTMTVEIKQEHGWDGKKSV